MKRRGKSSGKVQKQIKINLKWRREYSINEMPLEMWITLSTSNRNRFRFIDFYDYVCLKYWVVVIRTHFLSFNWEKNVTLDVLPVSVFTCLYSLLNKTAHQTMSFIWTVRRNLEWLRKNATRHKKKRATNCAHCDFYFNWRQKHIHSTSMLRQYRIYLFQCLCPFEPYNLSDILLQIEMKMHMKLHIYLLRRQSKWTYVKHIKFFRVTYQAINKITRHSQFRFFSHCYLISIFFPFNKTIFFLHMLTNISI